MRTATGLAPMGFADCWRKRFESDRRDVVASATCFPVDVTEGLSTDDWQHWRVGDATSWLQAWLQHAEHKRSMLPEYCMEEAARQSAAASAQADTCCAGTEGMRGAAAAGAWVDASTPARIGMQPVGLTPCSAIEFTSDGSVEDAECEAAKGTYG